MAKFRLENYQLTAYRYDSKIQGLLELTLHAAIVKAESAICEQVLQFARRSTLVLKIDDAILGNALSHYLRPLANRSLKDYSLIRVLVLGELILIGSTDEVGAHAAKYV